MRDRCKKAKATTEHTHTHTLGSRDVPKVATGHCGARVAMSNVAEAAAAFVMLHSKIAFQVTRQLDAKKNIII